MAALVGMAGCASHAPAPVIERAAPPPTAIPAVPAAPKAGHYVVKKGDTLYSIALDHGIEYKELAAWNNLDDPNRIGIGQQLRVKPSEGAPVAVAKPVAGPGAVEARPLDAATVPASVNTETLKREPRGGKLTHSEQALALAHAMEGAPGPARHEPPEAKPLGKPAPTDKPAEKAITPAAATGEDVVDWAWPIGGKVITQFVEGGPGRESNKGIDIDGKAGDPVQAAASGKVVYAGSGLRGYGNLVIVRHNAAFLSAYAHNSKILVKEGQAVSKGQKIAEVGSSDVDQPRLHFEIRHQGKPVDPLRHLPLR
ncbi:MAG: peptidoglycan DD-metalloendopeptidase family protein [Candidatus Nitricoxidivorans perseverans]|uniref:Peptidoglycan DD-metalloendopeptidase family protein n=1 Tax=Candidatus Nitricoxidivorans perseverans TaxID=2975601 RepID=A0AA49IY43_9PROT|nr:MAG: peptidoglycan DD-metalloendopeptidase family protein [Candidatus Nitricoxidivorans perseverans]